MEICATISDKRAQLGEKDSGTDTEDCRGECLYCLENDLESGCTG